MGPGSRTYGTKQTKRGWNDSLAELPRPIMEEWPSGRWRHGANVQDDESPGFESQFFLRVTSPIKSASC
jgi:hypothetical protein